MRRFPNMTSRLIYIGVALLSIMLAACETKKEPSYTVGVMNILPSIEHTLTGFKEGMTELGYIEGKNIHYIYDEPTRDMDQLSARAQLLLEAKVDLILSITTPATLAAKQATENIGLPVVFAVVTDPVGAGIVESIRRPGGNITGITFGVAEARRLEWLVEIVPQIKNIYVPFNPQDKAPVLALKEIHSAADKLGVKLITREVYDQETLNEAIVNIPAEADAVFLLPDSLRGTRLTDFVANATERKLPVSVANSVGVREHGILTSFGLDLYLTGRQAARLADQILKGSKPGDLPVELSEFYLAINLKVAETIGLTVPDEILQQAEIIIR